MSLTVYVITADTDLTNYTSYNYFLVDASGGSITVTLPDASADGITMTIRRIDSTYGNTVTVACQSGQTINGVSSIPLRTATEIDPASLNGSWQTPIYTAIATSNVPPVAVGAGIATLAIGTATVSTPVIRANSIVLLTTQTLGGIAGILRVTTKTEGTSFVINSSSPLESSTVAWMIVNNA